MLSYARVTLKTPGEMLGLMLRTQMEFLVNELFNLFVSYTVSYTTGDLRPCNRYGWQCLIPNCQDHGWLPVDDAYCQGKGECCKFETFEPGNDTFIGYALASRALPGFKCNFCYVIIYI